MRTKFVGIDIGKLGAIVIMEDDNIECHKMPLIKTALDYHALDQLFIDYEGFNGMIVFEKLGQIFKTSKATAFSMGNQMGAIEMLCISRAMPYTMLPAKQWQAEMFQGVQTIVRPGTTIRDTKAMALIAVKRLFPNQKLTFGEVAKKPHDGMIDALLMAEYAKRKLA